MNGTALAFDLAQSKFGARLKQSTANRAAAIENAVVTNVVTNNTSIALPEEISSLVTGSPFWIRAKTNRYLKLIREGHLDKLLTLAKLARERATEEDPSHWFAKACSKARWEKYTLPYFA